MHNRLSNLKKKGEVAVPLGWGVAAASSGQQHGMDLQPGARRRRVQGATAGGGQAAELAAAAPAGRRRTHATKKQQQHARAALQRPGQQRGCEGVVAEGLSSSPEPAPTYGDWVERQPDAVHAACANGGAAEAWRGGRRPERSIDGGEMAAARPWRGLGSRGTGTEDDEPRSGAVLRPGTEERRFARRQNAEEVDADKFGNDYGGRERVPRRRRPAIFRTLSAAIPNCQK